MAWASWVGAEEGVVVRGGSALLWCLRESSNPEHARVIHRLAAVGSSRI